MQTSIAKKTSSLIQQVIFGFFSLTTLFITACGGGDEPEPIEIDPNQVRDLIGVYEGLIINDTGTVGNQEIGLRRVNDSVVNVIEIGDADLFVGFDILANDLSIIDDNRIVLRIGFQVIGNDTIQGAPANVNIHGNFNKDTEEIEFSIRVNYFNEEFSRYAVANQIFRGVKTR